jgi:hypothetical protein
MSPFLVAIIFLFGAKSNECPFFKLRLNPTEKIGLTQYVALFIICLSTLRRLKSKLRKLSFLNKYAELNYAAPDVALGNREARP